jgi:Icc protein
MNSGAVSTSRRIEIAGWRVLMLNDWLAGSDGGRFSAAELEFLDSELAAAGPAPVLICLHHQPVPIGSPWMDAMGLDNGPEFLDIIDSYNNVCGVIWGHIHQEFNSERNGVPLLGTPSTCVQFKPGTDAYTVDPAAPGFRVLELLPGGKLDTRIIRCR